MDKTIISGLADNFERTISPNADIRKSGGEFIEGSKYLHKNYANLLFQLSCDDHFGEIPRHIASIALKNLIKIHWVRILP